MERYEMREQIGHGNYGTCHLAFHRAEQRPYVIKRIPCQQMDEKGRH
jgi:NIMA (never in mitosis gene a)-related kinase